MKQTKRSHKIAGLRIDQYTGQAVQFRTESGQLVAKGYKHIDNEDGVATVLFDNAHVYARNSTEVGPVPTKPEDKRELILMSLYST